jgi:putative transposase
MATDCSKAEQSFIEKDLCTMFSPEFLRKTAIDTGLIKRERKIDAVIMFWVLTLSFGVRLQRTLASLKRSYEKEAHEKLSDSSWYYRFTPELVAFLKACVIHGIEYLAQEQSHNLNKKLVKFQDVLIQDSTIVRLHTSLAKLYPAARSKGEAAGLKIAVLVSAVGNTPESISIYKERTNELKTIRVGPWIKGKILLIDLGFYKYQLFARIAENGGFFVSRSKDNSNPLIIKANRTWRGQSIDVCGTYLQDVLPKLQRQILDVNVEVSFKRRAYNGVRRQDTHRFRLVAIYNDEDEKYHTYITNINSDILEPEDIGKLYGARWDIELMFKELKSRYALDALDTKNPQIIEALIWVAILTLLVSRRTHFNVRKIHLGKNIVRFTQLRWSTIFAENANDQLTLILRYMGITKNLEILAGVYESQALDPHVNRERFRAEWWA